MDCSREKAAIRRALAIVETLVLRMTLGNWVLDRELLSRDGDAFIIIKAELTKALFIE